MPSLAWAILLLPTVYTINCYWCLYKNIQIAKRSGIPYVVVSWYNYNRVISLANGYRARWMDRHFPEPPTPVATGRRLVRIQWPWNIRYAPFAELGSDTFFTVAPGGLILYTADADVISQITSRSNEFPKPTHLYVSVDIYGKNIVSSEGAVWRHHRKSTAHSFTEKTNQLVWYETLEQTRDMLETWTKPSTGGKPKAIKIQGDTMRLSLHVMSRAGLGRKMEWPKDDCDGQLSEKHNLPVEHTLDFTDCLTYLLKNIIYVMVLPKPVLRRAPSKVMRKVYAAYEQFGVYMQEMIDAKKSSKSSIYEPFTTDLVSQLVKGQSDNFPSTETPSLTDSEVIGNLFVFIIAGHETSASSIHFSLILLALHPSIQRRVQEDLDRIFAGRPPSQWSYDTDLPKLQNSYLAAVLHEQLRVIPPTITIPKMALAEQSLIINDKPRLIPKGTMIRLCVPSVHRNPKFWPTSPPKDPSHPFHPPGNPHNDLEEFKPDRWLCDGTGVKARSGHLAGEREFYTPPRGAYIPFSLDSRACLGKRFAQVEILAALANVLATHTVELAVDEFVEQPSAPTSEGKTRFDEQEEGKQRSAGVMEAELANMSKTEKRTLWEKARDKGNWTWQNKAGVVITLQLRGGAGVPVRIVRRGEEVFGTDVVGDEW